MSRHDDPGGGTGAPARAVGVLLLATIALVPAPLAAQSIKIPDFRNEPAAAAQCANCGTVRSIREVSMRTPGQVPEGMTPRSTFGQGPGSETNVVGGIFVHSFSAGQQGQTTVGGVGTPEMQQRLNESSYELNVRMDDGSYRTVNRRDGASFQTGDRVRFMQGAMERF